MQIDPLLQNVIVTIITLVGSFLIYEWFSYFLNRIKQRLDLEVTLIQVIREIIKYSIIALGITIILKEWGVDIAPIIVSLGIVGVAVGFAARDTLSNFISGMFILAEKSFRVGDTLEIAGHQGKVKKVGFRVTTLSTIDNKIITVPNSSFSKNPYINFTTMETRRVDLNINISYSKNLEDVIPSLLKSAGEISWAQKEPKPKILIKEMTDIGIRATLSVWTSQPRQVAEYKSQLAQKVKDILVDEK